MIIICPHCRAPSNDTQARCWVCKRAFDGSEGRIGEIPMARRPLNPSRYDVSEAWAAEPVAVPAARRAGAR